MTKSKKSSYQNLAGDMKPNAAKKADIDIEEDEQEASKGALGFASHAEVEEQLAKVEAERDELKNKYLSTHADMENLRRRTEKDATHASPLSALTIL